MKYDDTKFKEVLLPAYRQMVSLFRDHLWLADLDTREYYPKLIGFVSTWERILGKSLPREVAMQLSVSESELQSFYDHLRERHDLLRNRLRQPRWWHSIRLK